MNPHLETVEAMSLSFQCKTKPNFLKNWYNTHSQGCPLNISSVLGFRIQGEKDWSFLLIFRLFP